MTTPEHARSPAPGPSPQWDVPYFDRLTYHYGQVLTPQQLQRAQQAVHDRAQLHNRCLHGWGVVCGLEVKPERLSEPECPSEDEQEEQHGHAPRTHLSVTPGLALDPRGRELVVREPLRVDVLNAMSPEDRKACGSPVPVTLWVSLRHHAVGIEPARPQLPETCGIPPEPTFTFWRDRACVEVTLRQPEQDERCETCCTPAPVEVVLLARIDNFLPGKPIRPEEIHNELRRPLSLRVPTVITDVSWHHGGEYHAEDVDQMLWTQGLRVRFSRPVYTETLLPGVFDVFLYELGKGRSGIVRLLKGEFLLSEQPPMVSEFTYRLTENERVDPGDRIVFVLRTDFVLDGCCMPVDGTHVGGRVPAAPPKGTPTPVRVPQVNVCRTPPRRFGAWTSGDGAGGGTFESWLFVVEERGRAPQKKEEAR